MGNCCKSMPDIKADVKVEGNKCFNMKKMLCCDCDDDTCLSSCKSSCCIVNNVTNNTFESPEIKTRELKKSKTI